MIASLQPYPEYKESGLLWLGPIPKHWKLLRSKYIFREVDERSITGEETRLSMSQRHGLIPSSRLEEHRLVSESQIGAKVCEAGYLVLNRLKAHLGVFALASQRGLVSPDYTVLRPTGGFETRYFEAFYRTPECRVELYRRAKGIVEGFWRLYTDDFYDIRAPVPDTDEQALMLRFLDHASGQLDRAIRAKRKVIALLHEQKQAIIHRAVTRGLDPTVPLKPSGIPWLGDVPRHWEVSRVKNEFRCLNTQRIPLNSVERGEMTSRLYDYYGASGVIDKVDDYLFDDELLLIAEDGANLVLRNLPLAIIARGKFRVNNHAHILKTKRGNIVYLANFLETLNYMPWISGAAQPKLTQDRLLSISIAVAQPEEQDAIVEHTTKETRPLVMAIGRLERQISLLREYRTRLVADVVTGKLDVRPAARELLTEPAETETAISVEEDTNEDLELEPEASDA